MNIPITDLVKLVRRIFTNDIIINYNKLQKDYNNKIKESWFGYEL